MNVVIVKPGLLAGALRVAAVSGDLVFVTGQEALAQWWADLQCDQ